MALPVHQTRVVQAGVSGFAVLDGTELPISSMSASFAINSIPSAQFVIPIGRAVDGKSASVDSLISELRQFRPIELFLRMTGEFAPDVKWPSDRFRVFNGYVAGTSLVQSSGTVGVLVNAIHWLIDLDASSALSADLVPGGPVAVSLPPVNSSLSSGMLDPSDPLLVDMAADMWRGGLKLKFRDICTRADIRSTLTCAPAAIQMGSTSNDRALRRITDGDSGVFDAAAVIDVPSLRLFDTADRVLRSALSLSTTSRLYNGSLGTSTLWEKLLELAQVFEFTVIPTVDSAVCAPLSPCLVGSDPPRHVTISRDEWFNMRRSAPMFRFWRGVALNGHFVSSFDSASQQDLVDYGVLNTSGCYLADADATLSDVARNEAASGVMQFFPSPDWAQPQAVEAMLQLLVSMDRPAHTLAALTQMGPPALAEQLYDQTQFQKFGDAYARAMYWSHQFRPRTGELSGKLRFDIAPGAIVRIQDLDDSTDVGDGKYMTAMVTSVQFSVDADSGSASTAMTFSHIRRQHEFGFGVDRHPLYAERWVGTVLQEMSLGNDTPQVGRHENP